MTQSDVQRYIRIALQWLATWLVARGVLTNASMVEPIIGAGVAIGSLAWTWYDTRPQQKINDTAKLDQVSKITVTNKEVAAAGPENVTSTRKP
jgi:hypothetical protein